MAKFNATFTSSNDMAATFQDPNNLTANFGDVLMVHTDNYEDLYNKPRINGHELIGDKTGLELELQDLMDKITAQDIDNIIFG